MGGEEKQSSLPSLFTESLMHEWLESALDVGLTEREYWDMTIAEINRAIESYTRQKKAEAREKAQFDYLLADLIGRSIARLYGSSNKYPLIVEAYPMLFEEEKQKAEEQRDNISILRFKQFAQLHNQKYQEGAKTD